jgi:NaMN:DMB phosphoribosyltransferase
VAAVRAAGDPVLAAVAGLIEGATGAGATVTLAGGTQLAAAAALARHAGVDAPLSLATTSFVAADDSAAIRDLAGDLDLSVTVTDPGFDRADHPAMAAYAAGEAKEGVGMGGALALAAGADASMADVRERVREVYRRLVSDEQVADEQVVDGREADGQATDDRGSDASRGVARDPDAGGV